jgi:Domain of unknown function (DUF4412)
MKLGGLFVSFVALNLALSCARADLTVVQKVEGAGPSNEMTMKLKGDKMRIEISPKLTTIIDAKTGDMINLMGDQKTVVRMSGDKVKAAMQMAAQFSDKNGKKPTEKPKLVSTGKKEILNGQETEQYTYETPEFKATYWIAPNYPNGAGILKQLQALNPDVWKISNAQMPDYREFPGLPIKTVLSMRGNQITTMLVSVKEDPLSDTEFSIPKEYQEMKLPDMSDVLKEKATPASSVAPTP